MNISDAIKRADEKRDNKIPGDRKAEWVAELNAQIAIFAGEQIPVNKWPEEDPELLMPFPYENVYPLYLCCMIDVYNEEMELYQIDRELFIAAYEAAMAWWSREHGSKVVKYWKVF